MYSTLEYCSLQYLYPEYYFLKYQKFQHVSFKYISPFGVFEIIFSLMNIFPDKYSLCRVFSRFNCFFYKIFPSNSFPTHYMFFLTHDSMSFFKMSPFSYTFFNLQPVFTFFPNELIVIYWVW